MLKGLLRWDPHARLTAAEALGKGRNTYAKSAQNWWLESPRAVEKELLPTYPEVRNRIDTHGLQHRSKADAAGVKDGSGDYIFDFDDGNTMRRPVKRPRVG